MAMKCKINASHELLPVGGTEADGKGTCPECLTPERKLTSKGFIGAHNIVIGVDATVPITDEGLRIGAPRDAAVKRELEGRRISAQREPVPAAQAQDNASAHRGPTLVRGRDAAPRLRDPELPWSEATDVRANGEVRKSTTLEGPLGREHFDRKITTVPEPKRRRTPAERRRYRRAQQAKYQAAKPL